jgi:hypothetical protein
MACRRSRARHIPADEADRLRGPAMTGQSQIVTTAQSPSPRRRAERRIGALSADAWLVELPTPIIRLCAERAEAIRLRE